MHYYNMFVLGQNFGWIISVELSAPGVMQKDEDSFEYMFCHSHPVFW